MTQCLMAVLVTVVTLDASVMGTISDILYQSQWPQTIISWD